MTFSPLRSLPCPLRSNRDPDESSRSPSFPPATVTDHPLYRLAGDLVRHPLSLGLTTLPILVGLAGGKQIANGLNEIGILSEELFRGDRLPLLHTSPPEDSP